LAKVNLFLFFNLFLKNIFLVRMDCKMKQIMINSSDYNYLSDNEINNSNSTNYIDNSDKCNNSILDLEV
jgi:hypothetical protein